MDQEEADLLKESQEMESLLESERRYRVSEDPFKSISMGFDEEPQSLKKEGLDFIVFEERVNYDNGDYIFVLRKPNISEDELSKLKKAKGDYFKKN